MKITHYDHQPTAAEIAGGINAEIRSEAEDFTHVAHGFDVGDHELTVITSLITKGQKMKTGFYLVEVRQPQRADVWAMSAVPVAHLSHRPRFTKGFIGGLVDKALTRIAGPNAPRLG
jgi:hypothetical protein